MSPNAIAVEASRLMRHPQVSLKIREGKQKEIIEPTATMTQFTHQKAVEMALAAAARADELGQSGAFVSAIRLASDLQGYIVERRRDIDPEEDPINKLMSIVAGHSRVSPAATRH